MVVAYLQRMAITNISLLISVIVLQFKESQHPFAVCRNFFDYLIYAKIYKNHTSDKFVFPSYCKQNSLNRKKRETEIEALKQMKKHFFTEDEELPGQH